MSGVAALKKPMPPKGASDQAIVGKDVLELISTAMYVDPLTIYREYVQNAADAIDAARASGVLEAAEAGQVEITVDSQARRILIRDNGAGIAAGEFAESMKAVGASRKRGTQSRGFRGVGRLAGLGYAQKLAFRSRADGDASVQEIVWDCRKLRTAMRSHDGGDLVELIEEITDISAPRGDWPDRFFEVELTGVIRLGDDRLMSAPAVSDYLRQVAPVPFSTEFTFAERIVEMLREHVDLGELSITINDGEPLTRPHLDTTPAGEKAAIPLHELSTIEITGTDGDLAAIGWIAHHDYQGAIPNAALVKGLRLRVGNIQVGETALLESIFPETRFNHWTVGEVHIVDRRIVPNGRRDNFEQNVHFANLANQMSPAARDVARRCRTSSTDRKRVRDGELLSAAIEERLDVLEQNTLGAAAQDAMKLSVDLSITKLGKLLDGDALELDGEASAVTTKISAYRERLERLSAPGQESPIDRLPKERRAMYREMIELIYECSVNKSAAKSLVDRILAKLA